MMNYQNRLSASSISLILAPLLSIAFGTARAGVGVIASGDQTICHGDPAVITFSTPPGGEFIRQWYYHEGIATHNRRLPGRLDHDRQRHLTYV